MQQQAVFYKGNVSEVDRMAEKVIWGVTHPERTEISVPRPAPETVGELLESLMDGSYFERLSQSTERVSYTAQTELQYSREIGTILQYATREQEFEMEAPYYVTRCTRAGANEHGRLTMVLPTTSDRALYQRIQTGTQEFLEQKRPMHRLTLLWSEVEGVPGCGCFRVDLTEAGAKEELFFFFALQDTTEIWFGPAANKSRFGFERRGDTLLGLSLDG